jgi:hypothetical protein
MEIDVREYVKWLLSKELRREPAPSVPKALKVARYLNLVAGGSKDPDLVRSFAAEIWMLPFRIGSEGPCAEHPEAQKFIERLQHFFGPEKLAAVTDALNVPTKELKATMAVPGLRNTVVYRDSKGAAMYLSRAIWPKKAPNDDLGFRIRLAYLELNHIGCRSPYVVLQTVLNERFGNDPKNDWSQQRIEKRMKPFKGRGYDKWPGWKEMFWRNHPSNVDKSTPMEQPFRLVFRPSTIAV